MNLKKILIKYNLKEAPSRIYNVDEKGLTTEHKPPKIVTSSFYKAQAITGGKSSITTVIGCGNAAGQQVPPFFVFAGKRMLDGLLDGATPGASGTVTDNGWSNTEVFNKYMQEHLVKFLPQRSAESYVLVMYDGHRSHVSLGLIEWARKNFIVLFVLPPHCSHLLQPLNVSCFGPMGTAWNAACHHHLRESRGTMVTRYDVCKLGCKAYAATLTPLNIQSAFKRCGVYPFDKTVVNDSDIAPSLSFPIQTVPTDPAPQPVLVSQIDTQPAPEAPAIPDENNAKMFLEKRGGDILHNLKIAKVRKTLSKVVGGKPITEDDVVKRVKEHIDSGKTKKSVSKRAAPAKKSSTEPVTKIVKAERSTEPVILEVNVNEPVPGTSGLNRKGGPIDLMSEDSQLSTDEDELCCVCGDWQPKELRSCDSIVFSKWAKCDICTHWTHLKFCTDVRVIRCGSEFRCPHCPAPVCNSD